MLDETSSISRSDGFQHLFAHIFRDRSLLDHSAAVEYMGEIPEDLAMVL